MKKTLLSLVIFGGFLNGALSEKDQDVLAKKWAPLLKLHPEELSFPSSIEWYLEHCDLMLREKGKSKLISSQPTAESLARLPDNGTNYYLNPRDTKTTYPGMPLKNNRANAPAYVMIIERKNGDEVVMQYLFFYPYQGPLPILPGLKPSIFKLLKKIVPIDKIGIHQSDWERTTVYLKKVGKSGDPDKDYELSRVLYGRHQTRKGKSVDAKDVKLADNSLKQNRKGTHPIVYVGKNSHAGYGKNVTLSSDIDMTSDKGPRWPTWEDIRVIGPVKSPRKGMEWIKATNVDWGSTQEAEIKVAPGLKVAYHGNSPSTPSGASWFARPQERAKVWIKIRGKEVDSIPVGAKEKKDKRYSDYFDLELPARLSGLAWTIGPEQVASQVSFDVYEYKYGGALRKDKKILSGIKGPFAETPMPRETNYKNLYIKNLKPDDLAEDVYIEVEGIE